MSELSQNSQNLKKFKNNYDGIIKIDNNYY